MKTVLDNFFKWNVRNKHIVIDVFKIGYALMVFTLGISAYFITQDMRVVGIYAVGELAGKISLVLFCITLLPGILRRFAIRGSLVSLIMLYRRHLGISTFVFAFYHYAAIQLFSMLVSGRFTLFPSFFEMFGVLSLYSMSLLFFTSNNWSVQKMGKWWIWIHALIYLIAWGIFAHVFLQGISFWSLLIGVFACFEFFSLVYFYSKKHLSNR